MIVLGLDGCGVGELTEGVGDVVLGGATVETVVGVGDAGAMLASLRLIKQLRVRW